MSLPANVCAVKDRHGRTRYRFRKAGFPSRYLPGPPNSNRFREVYEDCLRAEPAKKTPRQRRLEEFDGKEVVYFIGAKHGPVKIGTTTTLRQRFKTLQTAHPRPLVLYACAEGGPQLESYYHERFADHRLAGEWFERKGLVLAELERLRCPTIRSLEMSNPLGMAENQ